MKGRVVILALLSTGLLAGCSSAPPVNYDHDQVAGLSKYRSFEWLQDEGSADMAPETLMMTFVDGDTKRRLWQGTADFSPPRNTSPDEMDKACQKSVGKLLSYFPPPEE